MPDLTSMFGPGFFFAGDANSNTPQALRQKIALAMLMQKRKAPSNLGEGLSAIGDSLGDIGMMRRIEGEAAAGEQAGIGAENRILGGGGPQAVAPGSPPPVQAAAVSAPSPLYQPSPAPTDQTPVPGDVQEGGPPQTLPQFRPGSRTVASAPPAPPPAPAPGSMPPTGAPGNTGATTFAPPGGYPRLPVLDQTAFNSIDATSPNAPPALARSIGTPPSPPVMAQGEDDPRRAIALSMLRQGQTGQPQTSAFAPAAAAPPTDQGIQPAPPPATRAAAPPPAPPAQDLPEAGYVTPLPPPRRPPPLTTPTMQAIEQEIRAAPPSVRESVQARLMPLYEKEKGALAQAHEAYKDGLIQDRALELKHHEQRAAARSNVDASREAAQRIAKGNVPEVKQDIDTGLTFNAATGQWERPKISGAGPDTKPSFKPNEFQDKALVNYGRALIGHEGLKEKTKDGDQTYEEALAGSPLQAVLSAVPYGVTRSWRSDAYKEADTHADNFVQAFIRQQSGGAYGPAELEAEARGMLPKYGDTEKQLQTKREQREQFISSMHDVIGPGRQRSFEIDDAARKAARAEADKEKPAANKVLDFENEAEVAKARLKPGTRIRVNGRPATVE